MKFPDLNGAFLFISAVWAIGLTTPCFVHYRIAADATEKCDLAAKEFERKESELADKHDALKRQEELARRDRSDAVALCEKLREDLAKQRRIVDEKEEVSLYQLLFHSRVGN